MLNFAKPLDQGATKLVHKWQYVAHKLDENMFIRVVIEVLGEGKNRTIKTTFNSLFLGEVDQIS